jgi:hypothetical protein
MAGPYLSEVASINPHTARHVRLLSNQTWATAVESGCLEVSSYHFTWCSTESNNSANVWQHVGTSVKCSTESNNSANVWQHVGTSQYLILALTRHHSVLPNIGIKTDMRKYKHTWSYLHPAAKSNSGSETQPGMSPHHKLCLSQCQPAHAGSVCVVLYVAESDRKAARTRDRPTVQGV